MTSEEQLRLWVKGESVHNKERDECCPDFSCCCPNLLADQETRERFYKAWEEKDQQAIDGMLMFFLSQLLASNSNIHVAGVNYT